MISTCFQAPLFNIRIRKSVLQRGLTVAMAGPKCNLTYAYTDLGAELSTLSAIAQGRYIAINV